MITKRKLLKALKRGRNLPPGFDLVRYTKNKLSILYNRKSKKLITGYPSALLFEVTNHCNLHCFTCAREYEYGKNMDTGYMDLTFLKNIVDQSYPYIDSIGLTGLGEPLLFKQLPEALSYIKKKSKGIITYISSNASLPNSDEIIKKISPDLDTLQISIDGIGDIYNKIRKNGNFNNFISNVSRIMDFVKNEDTDVTFNMVLMKENYFQMTDILKLTSELGISSLNFTFFNLVSSSNIPLHYYNFFQSEEFKNELLKIKENSEKYPNVEVTFWNHKKKKGFKKCPYPWGHFYISWDGFLVPCCAKPFPKEMTLADLKNTRLIDSINSLKIQSFRKLWYKDISPDFCKGCHYTDLELINLE